MVQDPAEAEVPDSPRASVAPADRSPTDTSAADAALARAADALPSVEVALQRHGCADGPLAAAGTHHLGSGGKRMRACLALAAGQLIGLDARDAQAAATAVELIHNASLVHDDIMDRDTERRGQPTVWARDGQGPALLLGDRLLNGAYAAAAESARPGALVSLLAHRVHTLVDGQARELDPLAPAATADTLADRYLATARAKSGTLFALPVEAALTLGQARARALHAAAAAFESLGAAYQVRDDLADLDAAKDGRSRPADLAEGRLTAPVIQYLKHASPERAAALRAFLAAPSATAVEGWRAELRASGAIASTRRLHAALLDEATAAGADLPPGLRGLLARMRARMADAASAPSNTLQGT